jgi:glycosyltransferase involved in cell wall biosynthesis
MKKVLFIGATEFNFKSGKQVAHLQKKYEGLSRGIVPFILGRGKPFHKKIWGTEFYLLPSQLFLPLGLFLGFYLCLTKKIEIITTESPLTSGFFGAVLKKIFKKELIVEIHGDWKEGPFLSKKRKFEFLQRKITPVLAKISLTSADKIRCVASYLTEQARKIALQKRYFSFPTFTDLDSFLAETDARFGDFILSVGQLEKVKGMNVLIESFVKIEKEFPWLRLVIIGDGSEKTNIDNMSKDLGIMNKVDMKGKLPLSKTRDVMKRCYCFVLPSMSEGLPRVLMEAMALAKPVIASRVGGIPELVKDNNNGFLFKSGDSNDLADKLRILLKDKNKAHEMGQSGRLMVKEKLSNQKYISSYIEMINS